MGAYIAVIERGFVIDDCWGLPRLANQAIELAGEADAGDRPAAAIFKLSSDVIIG